MLRYLLKYLVPMGWRYKSEKSPKKKAKKHMKRNRKKIADATGLPYDATLQFKSLGIWWYKRSDGAEVGILPWDEFCKGG